MNKPVTTTPTTTAVKAAKCQNDGCKKNVKPGGLWYCSVKCFEQAEF